MLLNQLPADELAHVRDEIRLLRQREVELRKCFTDECDHGFFEGCKYDVEVCLQKRRVLAKDRLPAHILNDPQYYDVKLSPIVRVITRKEPRLPLAFAQNLAIASNDNIEVVEIWN